MHFDCILSLHCCQKFETIPEFLFKIKPTFWKGVRAERWFTTTQRILFTSACATSILFRFPRKFQHQFSSFTFFKPVSESRAGFPLGRAVGAIQRLYPVQVMARLSDAIPRPKELTTASFGGVDIPEPVIVFQGSRPSGFIVEDMMLQLLQDSTFTHGSERGNLSCRTVRFPCISDNGFSHRFLPDKYSRTSIELHRVPRVH